MARKGTHESYRGVTTRRLQKRSSRKRPSGSKRKKSQRTTSDRRKHIATCRYQKSLDRTVCSLGRQHMTVGRQLPMANWADIIVQRSVNMVQLGAAIKHSTASGLNPLEVACQCPEKQALDLLPVLLEAKASLDTPTSEHTPVLAYAASHSTAQVVKFLIDAGATSQIPYCVDHEFRYTAAALGFALERSNPEMVAVLLENGCPLGNACAVALNAYYHSLQERLWRLEHKAKMCVELVVEAETNGVRAAKALGKLLKTAVWLNDAPLAEQLLEWVSTPHISLSHSDALVFVELAARERNARILSRLLDYMRLRKLPVCLNMGPVLRDWAYKRGPFTQPMLYELLDAGVDPCFALEDLAQPDLVRPEVLYVNEWLAEYLSDTFLDELDDALSSRLPLELQLLVVEWLWPARLTAPAIQRWKAPTQMPRCLHTSVNWAM